MRENEEKEKERERERVRVSKQQKKSYEWTEITLLVRLDEKKRNVERSEQTHGIAEYPFPFFYNFTTYIAQYVTVMDFNLSRKHGNMKKKLYGRSFVLLFITMRSVAEQANTLRIFKLNVQRTNQKT